ncbi:hypothetical protein [Chitinophaga sancti]|uniref:Uncharacterized protein n=1 Tax=Chitinophaga sancti TaxID=1004 RepID=A0A1K1R4E0_9BACT|nr:hypothetical protein [Chitinophaga sancti]WQD64260.1 hypothetical protein U0033_07625 [Chitinophaga sancti]WQG90116.1 hypothetical protein SR876_01295 [Chitinophaga sancti]SFW66984.1 hypothetical protein SAMN05661012_03383 [Chitinophaga sancti]
MGLKILKTIAIVLLGILPYSTVLSNFSPYWTTTYTFRDYLVASLLFAIVSLLLGWWVSTGKLLFNSGFFFFLLGLLTAPPFMIGPPEMTPKLLERTTEEHFRYGLLLLSSIVFAIGFVNILRKYWKNISLVNKLIVVPFVLCFAFLIWDNVTSYNFSTELKEWINEGRDPATFFSNYDFQEFCRTLGRSLIYILIPWLSFILFKDGLIRKGQLIFLVLFSSIGILFFFLANFIGIQFYFPFMVPAVALAPAYWLSLMLISQCKSKNIAVDKSL